MAWLKLEDTFHDAPKIRRAARLLKIPADYADAYIHGTLARLWTWALRHAADGDLSGKHVDDIEIAVGWYGESGAWVNTLIAVGLLENDADGLRIHNARKYSGNLERAKQKRKERASKKVESNNIKDLTPDVARQSATVCDSRTMSQNVALERRGEEKRREEKILLPAPSATPSTLDESISKPESKPLPFAPAIHRPPVISIMLIDKTEFDIDDEQVAAWEKSFPAVDVMQQLRQIKEWAISNPTKKKTRRGIRKHITGWLSGKQDKGGGHPGQRSQPANVGYHPGSPAETFTTGIVKL